MTPSLGTLPINLPVLGPGPVTVTPTALDMAYAAGFFDGEGFVTIAFMSAKARTRGAVYTMRVGVGQNHLDPLLWLRSRWGGSVRQMKRRTAAHNLPYKWDCCTRMAAAFLRDVMPYLQVKRERAEIAIRFQESLFIPGKAGHTQAYREKLEGFRLELTGRNTHKPVTREMAV